MESVARFADPDRINVPVTEHLVDETQAAFEEQGWEKSYV
jgi:hypothetical protein